MVGSKCPGGVLLEKTSMYQKGNPKKGVFTVFESTKTCIAVRSGTHDLMPNTILAQGPWKKGRHVDRDTFAHVWLAAPFQELSHKR